MSSSNASRILFVKNLNVKATGNATKTRGTAFVVYEELNDAKNAYENLNGFHLQERYIVLLYYSAVKQQEKDLARREEELAKLKSKHNIPEATT